MNDNRLILEYLLQTGLLKKDTLIRKMTQSQKTGEAVLDLLITDGIISFDQLAFIYQKEWGFEIFDPGSHYINPAVVKSLPVDIIRSHGVFPFDEGPGHEIWLLMSDPTDQKLITQIHQALNQDIRIFVAPKELIRNLNRKYYFTDQEANGDQVTKSADIADELISEGVIRGASDIHIEPYQNSCRIRFRIDGVLYEKKMVSREVYKGLISKLKVLAGCDIGEHRLPQDGALHTNFQGRRIDLRLSAMPTIHGEKIVLRILDQQQFFYRIEDLGFSERQKSQLAEMLQANHGMILVTGPTGSGKTTTLYSFLKALNTSRENFVTIEDPVEFQMEGINQIQVNEKSGLDFASGLRSVLRQDPNVIMVGEIRDENTAAMATRAAITGHLLFSSVHTTNTVSTITRLLDMKVPAYLLSSALRGVISQRLLNRLCPHCRQERLMTQAEKEIFSYDGLVYDAKGCSICHGTGYQGRVAIQEVLLVNRQVREAISVGKNYDEIRHVALKQGLIPFSDSVLAQIQSGNISFSDGLVVIREEAEWHR
ncbi:GspE/PulE family protein [Eubacteriaceae bacterium ES2]|nr:GspE/PulE family protein [Eubacteriaceae bacterium ES2]